jgi:CDP-diacylglycerol---serine O-phosphatidyltransferase
VRRAIWRRRRTTDIPRPAGRRWARLRGSLARQVLGGGRVLVGRVGRRRREPGSTVVASVGGTALSSAERETERRRRLLRRRHADSARNAGAALGPGSAFGPGSALGTGPAPALGTGAAPGHNAEGELGALAPVRPGLPPSYPRPRLGGEAPTHAMRRYTHADDPTGPRTIPLLPGDHTAIRRVKFAVANACTVASLLLGMVAVFLALNDNLQLAAIALLGCVALDGFDGGLARRFGVASPFGAQMDSLADLSSFGVATGVVVYQWLIGAGATTASAGAVCALVVVCAAIRLARFNVSPKNGRFFCGVPTTMTAAVLALGVLLLGPSLSTGTRLVAVAVYALAMVSSFPYAKLVRVLRLPPVLFLVPLAGAAINVSATFTLIVAGYLVSGPMLWLRQRSSA